MLKTWWELYGSSWRLLWCEGLLIEQMAGKFFAVWNKETNKERSRITVCSIRWECPWVPFWMSTYNIGRIRVGQKISPLFSRILVPGGRKITPPDKIMHLSSASRRLRIFSRAAIFWPPGTFRICLLAGCVDFWPKPSKGAIFWPIYMQASFAKCRYPPGGSFSDVIRMVI